MYCGKCGMKAKEFDVFCAECGSNLKIDKKKKYVRNTLISGKGLLTDYSGIIVKISVILTFLAVTGGWIFTRELTNSLTESMLNVLTNMENISWNQMVATDNLGIKFIINSLFSVFGAWIQAQIIAFHSASIYVKLWYIINIIYYTWIVVATFFAVWRVFEKAGIQGWKALIPIYNIYCISKVVYENGWSIFAQMLVYIIIEIVLGLLMGAAGMVLSVIYVYGCIFVFGINLSMDYGHGMGYALGLIFLPVIFLQLIGWDNNEYQK